LDAPSAGKYPPRERSLNELAAQVRSLAESLGDDGERSWSKMLAAAVAREPDDEKLIWMGHAVALLLERGPQHWWRQRQDRGDVRRLLSDIVVKWSAEGM